MLGQSIGRNAISLSLFAIITAGMISITKNTTESKIEQNIRLAQVRALNEIIPPQSYDNQMVDDTLRIDNSELLPGGDTAHAYVARKDGKVLAVIIPVTTLDGYSGTIRSIVGVLADGTIAGVRVLSHKETPGLGDKIEAKKSGWSQQFIDKSLTNPTPDQWSVKKDGGAFDQLTGATITPRAVVKSVYRALEYFQAHRERLLKPLDVTDPNQATSFSEEQHNEVPHP